MNLKEAREALKPPLIFGDSKQCEAIAFLSKAEELKNLILEKGFDTSTCSTCHGEREVECDECEGTGKLDCHDCDGTGFKEEIIMQDGQEPSYELLLAAKTMIDEE
jgi:RecJ-like exonuclease